MSDTSVYLSPIPFCSFNCPNLAMVDGATNLAPFYGIHGGGMWAYMCKAHFDIYGIGLGLGKGQMIFTSSPGLDRSDLPESTRKPAS